MRWIKSPFAALLTILAMLLSQSVLALEWGEGFDPVDPPAITDSGGKIEVVEFFWYGCPHCYTIDPEVKAWLKKKPEDVVFRHVPAPLNPRWAAHARFFYAAEILGVADKLHKPLFEAMHKENRRLFDKESLLEFAGEQGVDKEEFRKAWDSFAVALRVQRAKKLAEQYQIDSVPVFGVNGKYKTSVSLTGSSGKLFEIIDKLISEEKTKQVATESK